MTLDNLLSNVTARTMGEHAPLLHVAKQLASLVVAVGEKYEAERRLILEVRDQLADTKDEIRYWKGEFDYNKRTITEAVRQLEMLKQEVAQRDSIIRSISLRLDAKERLINDLEDNLARYQARYDYPEDNDNPF